MEQLELISSTVVEGKASLVKNLVEEALDKGLSPVDILINGVIKGMDVVSQRFQSEDFYIPDVLLSSRAVHAGMRVLNPSLLKENVSNPGEIVIGTVAGDLHDIGKNLVKIFLKGKGYKVIDLGIDVSAEDFVEAVEKYRPQVLAMSALLTTTMPVMRETIQLLEQKGLRKDVQVIIGGAPVTFEYMKTIKADGYANVASQAPELVAQCLARLQS
ncbi:MAG TPA: cobalamin-binding protein [Clostridia bacterium]|nr:cobalamin-binding protein [Clostridia bacterium]